MNESNSQLRKALAGLAGLALGALAAAALIMLWAAPAWSGVLAILFCGLGGLLFGDRGLMALLRIVGRM